MRADNSPELWLNQESQVSTYLRRYKVGSVAGGHQKPVIRPQLFSKAKVTDSQAISVAAHIGIEYVGWLQVPVYYLQ